MVSRVLLVLFCLSLAHLSVAQSLSKMEAAAMNTSRITLSAPDSVRVFSLLPADVKVSPLNEYTYTWYGHNQLKHTQGGFSGRLLHGEYTAFSQTHELGEKGMYAKGLKMGLWKRWHPNGTIQSLETWRKSIRQGTFTEYYPNGQLLRQGKYKQGKLQGTVYRYNSEGQPDKLRYRRGELKKKKEKKVKSVVAPGNPTPGDSTVATKKVRKVKFWKKKKDLPPTIQPTTNEPSPPQPVRKRPFWKRWFSKEKLHVTTP